MLKGLLKGAKIYAIKRPVNKNVRGIMEAKSSEDIVPISDFKVNPGKIIRQIQEVHRPFVLTNRGRGVAVIQPLHDYESRVEERDFMRAVVKGIVDLEEGRELSLKDAKKHLNIKDI